jgi:PEP-utilising enzyme, mobile domain
MHHPGVGAAVRRGPAVVADVEGPLRYGSIVAREYGIPAVLDFQKIELAVDGISAEGWQAWH